MPRIPYVDPDKVTDPEIKGYLERARREGTPRPESQAVRANVPDVIRAFSQAWEPHVPQRRRRPRAQRALPGLRFEIH